MYVKRVVKRVLYIDWLNDFVFQKVYQRSTNQRQGHYFSLTVFYLLMFLLTINLRHSKQIRAKIHNGEQIFCNKNTDKILQKNIFQDFGYGKC